MTNSQKFRAHIVKDHHDYLLQQIKILDNAIAMLSAPFDDAITLFCSVPGVDRCSATSVLSEIGTDMSQFSSSKRLCCWGGLTPGNNESAGKKKSVKITHAGVYLKPMLVQIAHAAVKSTAKPYYRIKYERLSKRRGKKRAIIAIARMILTSIFHMLSTGELWCPSDLDKIDMSLGMHKNDLENSLRKAVKLLVSYGMIRAYAILSPKDNSKTCPESAQIANSFKNRHFLPRGYSALFRCLPGFRLFILICT